MHDFFGGAKKFSDENLKTAEYEFFERINQCQTNVLRKRREGKYQKIIYLQFFFYSPHYATGSSPYELVNRILKKKKKKNS